MVSLALFASWVVRMSEPHERRGLVLLEVKWTRTGVVGDAVLMQTHYAERVPRSTVAGLAWPNGI